MTKVQKIWTVEGIGYFSAADAAKHHGVSNATARHWCMGRVILGRYYPPRPGCYVRDVVPGMPPSAMAAVRIAAKEHARVIAHMRLAAGGMK